VVSDLNVNIGRATDNFGEKKALISGFAYPYSAPSGTISTVAITTVLPLGTMYVLSRTTLEVANCNICF